MMRIVLQLTLILFLGSLSIQASGQTLDFPERINMDPDNPFDDAWSNSGTNVEWSTEQSATPSHSIKLTNPTSGAWAADAFKAWVSLSGVPQTGIVKVAWKTYFETLEAGNKLYYMAFGYQDHAAAGGAGNLLIIGFDGTQIQPYDGNGAWQATGVNVPLSTWLDFTVLLDQDAGTYDFSIDDGTTTTLVIDDGPFINSAARLGDGSNEFISSYASWGISTYFIDDFIVGDEDFVPVELSTFVVE